MLVHMLVLELGLLLVLVGALWSCSLRWLLLVVVHFCYYQSLFLLIGLAA